MRDRECFQSAPSPVNAVAWLVYNSKRGHDTQASSRPAVSSVDHTCTSPADSGYGSGRMTRAFTTEKMATVAPMLRRIRLAGKLYSEALRHPV
jgi:hypothetical protein